MTDEVRGGSKWWRDVGGTVNLSRLIKWEYSPSLVFSGANTLCSVVFQLGALYKLGVGARSDLYYASIVVPTVLYTLAFGALTNVLIPMFVEAKTRGGREEIVLLWNCLFLTTVGGSIVLAVFYVPVLAGFPLLFRKLSWIDLRQVGGVLLWFSFYQVLYTALVIKSCFLFSRGRPMTAQFGTFLGWLVSLAFLSRIHVVQNLSQIPLCLMVGNAVALLVPNLGRESLHYRKGFLRSHASSLVSRNLPLVVGGSVSSRLEPLFDGVLASFCKEGSLTIYFFFGRIMLYVATITSLGYMQPVQKVLAEIAGKGHWPALRNRTKRLAVRATVITLGLLTVGVLMLVFVYLRGLGPVQPYFRYFANDLPVFFLMFGYLVGMLIAITYSNALFALRKERLFLWASLAVFPAGVLLKFAGAYTYGLGGLALGTSLYWMLNAAALVFLFSRHLDQLEASLERSSGEKERSVEIAAISAKQGGY